MRGLERVRVVVLAPAIEVRRGEEVVEDEIVEDDDGGRPPAGREERLDGRRVQRVVADLEEEDVVLRAQRPRGSVGLIGDERKRRVL